MRRCGTVTLALAARAAVGLRTRQIATVGAHTYTPTVTVPRDLAPSSRGSVFAVKCPGEDRGLLAMVRGVDHDRKKPSADTVPCTLLGTEAAVPDSSGGAAVVLDDMALRRLVEKRVDAAFALRRRVSAVPSPGHDTAFRAVHGAADGLPGCIVDVFDRLALVDVASAATREALGVPLMTVLRDRGLEVFDVSSSEGPRPPKLADFADTGAQFGTHVRHDLSARAARCTVAAVAREAVARAARGGAGAASPAAVGAPLACLSLSFGGNGAFALAFAAAVHRKVSEGGAAETLRGGAAVDIIDACPTGRRVICTNLARNGFIRDEGSEAAAREEKRAAVAARVFGGRGKRCDIAATAGPSAQAAAGAGVKSAAGSDDRRCVSFEPLRAAVGVKRRYNLATVEVTGAKADHIADDEMDAVAAASALVQPGGHVLVWFRGGGRPGENLSPAAFLEKLSPRFNRVSRGVQRRALLVADVRTPTDFPCVLPGPSATVRADGTVEWTAQTVNAVPTALGRDTVPTSGPVGWLFFVES